MTLLIRCSTLVVTLRLKVRLHPVILAREAEAMPGSGREAAENLPSEVPHVPHCHHSYVTFVYLDVVCSRIIFKIFLDSSRRV